MDRLIEITVTDGCNKNCSYCFEKGRSYGRIFGEWLPLISAACEDVESGRVPDCDGVNISFWGGEPFLRCDRMLDVIGLTSRYGFVSYHVYTNATLGRETQAFLADPRFKGVSGRFSAQVSYDGSPCNEKRRGYGFDAVKPQAEALAKADVRVSFKATLCPDDIPILPEIWDSYAGMVGDWPGIEYSPTLDVGAEFAAPPEEWTRVLESLCRREYGFYGKRGRFLMSWFGDDSPKRCRLEGRVFLHTDGSQYACHGCPYSGDGRFRLGSSGDGKLLFAPREKDCAGSPCESCDATYCVYCNMSGVPGADLAASWNSGRGRDEAVCRMYREFGWYRRALVYALMKGK